MNNAYQVEVNQDPSRLEISYQQAVSAWQEPPLAVNVQQATGNILQSSRDEDHRQGEKITGFTQSSAGMIVQFAVFGLINSSMLLVMERKSRCLQRLLTTPIKRTQTITGHILAMFAIVFLQEVILVLLGQFVFGVDYLRQPLAILLMMVALALWSASLGLLIGALAGMDGFQNIVMRGLGFGSVLAPAGLLSVYTLVFFGLAVWRFKFE